MAERSSSANWLHEARADLCRRWQAGERPRVEIYWERYPQLRTETEPALELIYQELLLRQQLGETPSLDEYLLRFPQLRRQLEKLFAIHQLLEEDPATHPGTTVAGPCPPADSGQAPICVRTGAFTREQEILIPGYEILDELGRGAAGVVYRARHLRLKRLVALKVIATGTHAAMRQCERFRVESEAVARLRHPHVVQIYEVGGQEKGTGPGASPYLALEYVDGGTLGRKLAGTPLPPRDAARLAALLARAVACVHRAGIVHRDLKPSNVLLARSDRPEAVRLGNRPDEAETYEPKIADFGLAKHVSDEPASGHPNGLTAMGDILGTPSYMAPEQALGRAEQVGPAADIYALGAILYELLTGRPPFMAATPLETLDQVRIQEPVPPANLQPWTPRDLETICLKCLQKAPEGRYHSANDLADDLDRFLAGRPIQARPVSWPARAVRWCRRKPALAGTLGLLVLTLVGGLAGVIWQMRRTEAMRAAAQANLERARAAVNRMLTQVGNERLAHVPQMDKLRLDLVEEALELCQEFLVENPGDETVRHEAARTLLIVGRIRSQLGKRAETLDAYRKAIDVLQPLIESRPDVVRYQEMLSDCFDGMGQELTHAGQFSEAEKAFADARHLIQSSLDANPLDPRCRCALATSFYNQAWRLLRAEKYREAESWLLQARELTEKLIADFPETRQYQQLLVRVNSAVGTAFKHTSQRERAKAAYLQAVELLESLIASHPEEEGMRNDLAMLQTNLAHIYRDAGQGTEAESAYRSAIGIFERLIADFPSTPGNFSELGAAWQGLALLQKQLGRPKEARESLEMAIRRQRQARLLDPAGEFARVRLRNHYYYLCDLLNEQGEHAATARTVGDFVLLANRWIDIHFALMFLSRCQDLVRKDTDLPPAEREERAEAYARQAVDVLWRALPEPYFDGAKLRLHAAYQRLQQRDDFKKLMGEVESREMARGK